MVGLDAILERHLPEAQLATYGTYIFGASIAGGEDEGEAVLLRGEVHGIVAGLIYGGEA